MGSLPQQASDASEKKFFDCDSGAAFLRSLGIGATPRSMAALIASGDISRIKFGRKYYVTKDALLAYLARAQRRPK